MRRIHYCRALAGCGLFLHLHVSASIVVGSGGAPQTFDAPPFAADWSTLAILGANTDITLASQLDTAVHSLGASAINQPLAPSSILPPATVPQAVWNSLAQNLQMRPTAVSYAVLMATLRNDTGSAASFLNVSYDFGSAYTQNVSESVPGWRAYFSLTGAPGSFQFIPELSTGTAGSLSATLDLGNWANGSPLYLLWADDNGPGSAGGEGGAVLEGAYTLDNFLVAVPEPSLMGLALTGALAGVALWRRTRSSHKARD